jgi:Zn-dependent M28 family amino/carboxypeptidase
MHRTFIKIVFLILTASLILSARQQPPLNPEISEIVAQVSADHIATIQKKLESFGTRNIYSATDDPQHGIGGAREWIAAQFKEYSPKLEVSFDKHRVAKQGRAFKNVEIWNVVAVLKGTSEPEEQVIVSGHYDSIHMVNKPTEGGGRQLDAEATVAAIAPGVTDDGSGTAAVLELARVMSQFQFRKTIVFITFAAEEYGLFGSSLYAEAAAAKHDQIEGVFNNDIIGSNVTGNGETSNRYVNVYSEDPNDSISRQLARYIKAANEKYQPGFDVNLVFRHDRFGRGGDHSPFAADGFAAIRITTPMENFANQHTATDTFANTAPAYTALVAKANAAGIAELALAPKTPQLRSSGGALQGRAGSPLTRGSGYDAAMTWHSDNPEPDLAGYAVVLRKTTSPVWEREIFVGNVTKYTLPSVNIDEVVLGVKAIDKAGNESLTAAFVSPAYESKKIETY